MSASRYFVALTRASLFFGLALILFSFSASPLVVARGSLRESTYQATTDWVRYTVKGRDFSFLMPTTPAMTTYHYPGYPTTQSKLKNQIGAYSNGVVYSVNVFERRESLKEFMSRFSRSAGDYKRELKVDSVSGTEYGFEADTISVRTQVFITSKLICVFRAQGSSLGNPGVGLPIFFDSIRFARTQTAVAIVDGPGDQPSPDPSKVNTNPDAKILSGKEVTRKPIVVMKPEPSYTENARQHSVTGTVVLRAILTSSGAVTGIRAIKGLPDGLTEKAIGSARQIKFIPAVKDDHFVSMYIQLEYSFNLY